MCGGWSNVIGAHSGLSAIVGGWNNIIEGSTNTSANFNVIGGGFINLIQTNAGTCFIGSGVVNQIETNAHRSAILCGNGNRISKNAFGASVVNGWDNRAGGTNSMAGGYRAKANHNGTYVWGDYSAEADVASTGNNQYIIRAAGGIWLGTNSSPSFGANRFIDTASGGNLTHGGTWANNSDRNSKENFKPVDGRQVLEKLAAMPVTTWNYKVEGKQIKHIGPVAQDFQSTFHYGGDEKSISTSDASGVAFAAIQGLYEMLQEKEKQLGELRHELKIIKERLEK